MRASEAASWLRWRRARIRDLPCWVSTGGVWERVALSGWAEVPSRVCPGQAPAVLGGGE